MSFISSQIKDSSVYDYLADQAADEIEALEKQEGELRDRIKQLEQELAEAKKDQARYHETVRLYISGELPLQIDVAESKNDFDVAIDAAIKESSK